MRRIPAGPVTTRVVRIRVVRDTIPAPQARVLPILVRPITLAQRPLAALIPAPHTILAQRQVPVRQEIHVLLRLVLRHLVRQRQATPVQPVILARPIIRAGQGTRVVRIDRV